MKKVILFFALIMGVTFFAAAQATPKATKIQVRQSNRIAHGVANGELTRHEARQLKRQQKHIQNEKRVAKSDGVVTRRERAEIRRDQKVANRSIYRQKNDVQNRY